MRRRVWFGFGAYCLLAGSTWLASAYLVPTWPDLLRLSVHDGVLCIVFCVVSLLRGEKLSLRVGLEAGFWSGLLFAGGPFVASGAGGSVSNLTQVLLFTIVPVMTAFLMGQTQEGGDGLGMLAPILAGAGGLALLLPFTWPGTGTGWSWFALLAGCAFLLAIAGIRLKKVLMTEQLLPVAAVGCGVASLLAGVGWRLFSSGPVEVHSEQVIEELLWALTIDGTLVLLILWLVKRLDPVSFSIRFLLVPWVTIVGGLFMMRQNPAWTSLLGLALTLATGTYVLIGSETKHEVFLVE